MDYKRHYHTKRSIRAFSLMELMTAVMMVGILSAIVYPSYTNYIVKSRRTDALTTLSKDQIALERCYSQNFTYNAPCKELPIFPQISLQGFYTLNISHLGTSTYTLTATPRGSQTHDSTCSIMAVNQINVRTASDANAKPQSTCWDLT